jgi:hypothetical protein
MAPLVKKCQQRPLKPVKSALYTTKFELGGGIVLFCCQKWVGGLGPIWSCPKKPPHPSFSEWYHEKPHKKLENLM